MTAVLAGPQAEAVMMLGCEDNALHSGLAGYTGPLLTVKVRWSEDVRVLISGTPLIVGESIGAKMNEHIIFHSLPLQLSGSRYRAIWLRSLAFLARSRHHKHGDGCY